MLNTMIITYMKQMLHYTYSKANNRITSFAYIIVCELAGLAMHTPAPPTPPELRRV